MEITRLTRITLLMTAMAMVLTGCLRATVLPAAALTTDPSPAPAASTAPEPSVASAPVANHASATPAAPAVDEGLARLGEEHLSALLAATMKADQKFAFRKPVGETADTATAIRTEFDDFIHPPAYVRNDATLTTAASIKKAKARAAAKDPYWMEFLGQSLITGKGVPQDTAKGIVLLTKAAEAGNDRAICRLAHLYEIGLLVPQDKNRAIALYQECGKKESGGQTLLRLGLIYQYGFGVPHDYQQAISWFSRAANDPLAGNLDAAFAMGRMYAKGLGVPRNYKKAVEWFARAANSKVSGKATAHRNGNATCALAIAYRYGLGAEKNASRSDFYLHQEQSQQAADGLGCKAFIN